MFDNSGREFIHASQIMQFFFFFPVLLLFLFMVYRVFRDQPFYGEANFMAKKNDEYQPNQFEEASPGLDNNEVNIEFGSSSAMSPQGGSKTFQFDEHKESKVEYFESIYFDYYPLMGIAILNMLNFSSYVFCALMFFAWILSIFIFNKMKVCQHFAKPDEIHYSQKIHLVFILILFFNYFITDQSSI